MAENPMAVNFELLSDKARFLTGMDLRVLFAVLFKQGILLAPGELGSCLVYRLNPEYGWKGTERNYQQALKEGLSLRKGERSA